MNFYKHHIGDYAQATAHLSFVEDAAYSRCIRKYYAEEKPLSADVKAVQRLVGARTREERQAVEDVLNEFFYLADDGWHNKRCDEELARANAQAETNRQIAQVREANKKAKKEAAEDCTNRSDNRNESCNEPTNDSFSSREPSQTPDTRHQTPDFKTITQDEVIITTSPGEVCASIKKLGIIDVNPSNPTLQKLIEAGATLAEFQNAAANTKTRKFNYVVGIVKGQREDAAKLVLHTGRLPQTISRQDKRTHVAQQMFGDLANGNDNPRIIDVSPASESESGGALISTNGKPVR